MDMHHTMKTDIATPDSRNGAGSSLSSCSVLWLSLPDDAKEQDAPLIKALAAGDTYTTDMHQAARMARMGHTVKRRDRHTEGHLVETSLSAEALDMSIDRGFEMRGARGLNRPNIKDQPTNPAE